MFNANPVEFTESGNMNLRRCEFTLGAHIDMSKMHPGCDDLFLNHLFCLPRRVVLIMRILWTWPRHRFLKHPTQIRQYMK